MKERWIRTYEVEIKDEHRIRAELAILDVAVGTLVDAICQQWHVGENKPLFLWPDESGNYWGEFNDGNGTAIFGPVEYDVEEVDFGPDPDDK